MPWIIAGLSLLIYEFLALYFGWKTLSRMMWEATQKWPFLQFLVGFLVGGLAVHFFWHWCPAIGQGVG